MEDGEWRMEDGEKIFNHEGTQRKDLFIMRFGNGLNGNGGW